MPAAPRSRPRTAAPAVAGHATTRTATGAPAVAATAIASGAAADDATGAAQCSGRSKRRLQLGALLLLSAACGDGAPAAPDDPDATAPAAWRDVTDAAGLRMPLVCGSPSKDTILGVNGNGAALTDLDGDGDLDVLLVDGSTRAAWTAGERVTHTLLLNDGVRDGVPRFTPAGDTGLVMGGWPTGVAGGDVDRDGRLDVLVGGLGEDALFLAEADAPTPRFRHHVLPGRGPLDWTTSVALGDLDGDGALDAWLTRYLECDPADPPLHDLQGVPCEWQGLPVMCGPHGLPPQPDVLLRGDGAGGFRDVSEASGLRTVAPAYGLGVVLADVDLDGDLDVYVSNDSVDNHLWVNDGAGVLHEMAARSGTASDMAGRAQAGMGLDVGDLDGDGDLDLVVTNFSDETNALYRQDGSRQFRDVTTSLGLGHVSRNLLGWGVHMADFDADGLTDLVFANGHVYPQADDVGGSHAYAQPLVLMRGTEAGRFERDTLLDEPLVARAMARGDVDDDGDLDLLVLVLDEGPRLLLNPTDAPERQLLIELHDPAAPWGGASILLDHGARTPLLSQTPGGFQAASDHRLHAVLEHAPQRARILWPGNHVEDIDASALAPGHRVVVQRGSGVVSSTPLRTR